LERTLLIVKPDAVSGGHTGDVISLVEKDRFTLLDMKMLTLDREDAARLYAPHRGKPFYDSLIEFMTSGPVVVCVLERDNAVTRLRELLGDTDSRKAAPGTVRALYGTDNQKNAAHGSDSADSFERECAIFFSL
jgi:nucleoside diphosphate kinase